MNEHTTQVVEAEHKGTRKFFENTVNDMRQKLIAEVRSEVRSEMKELLTPQRHIPSAVSVGEASSTVPDIHRRESFIQTPSRRASSLALPTDPEQQIQHLKQENKDLEDQLRFFTTPAKCSSNFKANEMPLYHSEVPKIDEEIRRKAEGRCKEAKKKANMPLSESSRPTTRSRARKQASKL